MDFIFIMHACEATFKIVFVKFFFINKSCYHIKYIIISVLFYMFFSCLDMKDKSIRKITFDFMYVILLFVNIYFLFLFYTFGRFILLV